MRRHLLRVSLLIGVLLLALLLTAWFTMRASLPKLDGTVVVATQAPASIARDALGTAVITARSRGDAYFAQGFVHAQERFFEMDLARRAPAGELAALFGKRALPLDRAARLHRMRARLTTAWQRLPTAQRDLLSRYCAGVNAGLASLGSRPWAYLLLRTQPQNWREVDSLLVSSSMFFGLQDATNKLELHADLAQQSLSPEAFAFLFRRGSAWDAPLFGGAFADPPLPTPAQLDLRAFPAALFPALPSGSEAQRGSNNWVIGSPASGQGALVANDMHLGLGVPSVWFRQQLNYPDPENPAQMRSIVGVALPGAPATVIGSNGEVAWGFTNSYGDWLDFVRLEILPDNANAYRTANGSALISDVVEQIEVKGGAPETLVVRETVHGPITAKDAAGGPLALAWVAHRLGGLDLTMIDAELAHSAAELLALVQKSGVPHLNTLAGDAQGHIGWSLAGRVPRRVTGQAEPLPVNSSSLAGDVWDGWLDFDLEILDPPSGRLWSANTRVVEGEALALLGDGGYALGARAKQIRDRLMSLEKPAEADLLSLQLDDRAQLMEGWWLRLTALLQSDPNPKYGELRKLLGGWNRQASIDSVAYRVVRSWRMEIIQTVISGLAAPMRARQPDYQPAFPSHAEAIVWQLLNARPAHLLPQPAKSWEQLQFDCLNRVLKRLSELGPLSERSWGEFNSTQIRHPLSRAVPALSWLLDMPSEPGPGDSAHLPRAQSPSFGASQRMGLRVGAEANGYFHMPGGQSGHPLSPFYGAGHADWLAGTASPLLPGKLLHTLNLQPLP